MRTSLFSLVALALTALQVQAETITVGLQDFQASGVLGYKYASTEVDYGSFGVFRLVTSDPSGPLASKVGNPAFVFCDELTQPFTSDLNLYDVGVPTDANDPPNEFVGKINSFKATLLSELFTKYLDTSWFAPGPYSVDQITSAMAFHAAIEEIVHEAVFSIADHSSLNLDAGIFQVDSAYLLDHNDPSQLLPAVKPLGQFYLDSLTGIDRDPKFELIQLTNPTYQDYLVAVPEVSSTMLLSAVGIVMGMGGFLKRRVRSAKA